MPKESYSPAVKRSPRAYVVRQGDTLRKISKKFYNDPNKWRRIFTANQGVLKDPNVIQVGTKLMIP